MVEKISNNKRIAKNTLLLYVRLLLIVGVSLYTSRIVLQILGVDDFGIYNVVGGFVAMLAYLRNVFVDATQRFIAYALGEGNESKLREVFSTSMTVFILLALLLVIIAETFGLWFVNNKIEIDPDRLYAANWVYQCSVITLVFSLLTVPYNSSIIAYERMNIFAYVSVVESILKLLIVYLLLISPEDKLITYAILHLVISFFVWLFYRAYSRRNFAECKYKVGINKPLFKEMFSFSGWTLIGGLGFSFKDQASNIILNLFLGTAINAARGIALQVNSIIMSFSNNLFTAISPQITKLYAQGNIQESQKLVYVGARYTFFLMTLFTIPIILNVNYVLELWLKTVPEYTAEFLIITLISSSIYVLSKPLTAAIQATGDIKTFQIGVSIIMLLELPMAWVLLKMQYPPYYALLPSILTNLISIWFRIWNLKTMIKSYSYKFFLCNICLKCIMLFATIYIICFYICRDFPKEFVYLILSCCISLTLSCIIIFFLGMHKYERKKIICLITNKITRK